MTLFPGGGGGGNATLWTKRFYGHVGVSEFLSFHRQGTEKLQIDLDLSREAGKCFLLEGVQAVELNERGGCLGLMRP